MKDYKSSIISTGNEKLDKLLGGGFKRKEVNIVASRPGEGKTVLLFDIANKIADQGNLNVYYMHTDAFDKNVLKRKNILYKAINYFFRNDYNWLIGDLKRYDADVVIIDTLNKGSNPWIEADESQFYHLSKIAKVFNVAIIVSNELDRSMYQRRNREPTVDDLRIQGDYQEFVSNIILIKSKFASIAEDDILEYPLLLDEYRFENKTICVYDNKKKEIGHFQMEINYEDNTNEVISRAEFDELYEKYVDAMKILQDN